MIRQAAHGGVLARLLLRAALPPPVWSWDGGGCRRSRSHREADGPPGGGLYFGPDGVPAGRSERWRAWAGL